MTPESASIGYSLTTLVSVAAATGIANGVIGIVITYWLVTRKKLPQELHESKARTRLADAQTDHTLAETLEIVSGQLRQTVELLEQAEDRYNSRTEYIDLLESQVQKAMMQGYLKREELGGRGPNPAA